MSELIVRMMLIPGHGCGQWESEPPGGETAMPPTPRLGHFMTSCEQVSLPAPRASLLLGACPSARGSGDWWEPGAGGPV